MKQRRVDSRVAFLVASIMLLATPVWAADSDQGGKGATLNMPPLRATPNSRESWTHLTPPLPAPKFLDAEQERLYQSKQPKTADFIYFVDGIDSSRPELNSTGCKLKPWTSEEKEDVEAIADRILHIVPALLIAASSGSKIALCRTDKIVLGATVFGSVTSYQSPSAISCSNVIVLANRFFEQTRQFHGLTHELVHEADLSGRINYSKEWVSYMNPIISKARLQMSISPLYSARLLVDKLRSNNACPTGYGCSDLGEALAEMMAASVDESGFETDPVFFTRFAHRLMFKSPEEMHDDLLFKRGLANYRNKQYPQAAALLHEVTVEEPGLPVPHTYLAAASARSSNNELAMSEVETAIQSFNDAGVPWNEPDMLFALRGQAANCLELKDNAKGLAVTTSILSKVPYDKLALWTRSGFEWFLKRYGDSARDMYLGASASDYAELLRDADTDPQLAQQCLDKDVEKFPGLPLTLLRRGRFFEWLADRQTDTAKQDELYKQAFTDFEKAVRLSNPANLDAIFECSNVNLKLKNIGEAERYADIASATKPQALQTKLIHIQILDYVGKKADAAEQCSQLWKIFGGDLKAKLVADVYR